MDLLGLLPFLLLILLREALGATFSSSPSQAKKSTGNKSKSIFEMYKRWYLWKETPDDPALFKWNSSDTSMVIKLNKKTAFKSGKIELLPIECKSVEFVVPKIETLKTPVKSHGDYSVGDTLLDELIKLKITNFKLEAKHCMSQLGILLPGLNSNLDGVQIEMRNLRKFQRIIGRSHSILRKLLLLHDKLGDKDIRREFLEKLTEVCHALNRTGGKFIECPKSYVEMEWPNDGRDKKKAYLQELFQSFAQELHERDRGLLEARKKALAPFHRYNGLCKTIKALPKKLTALSQSALKYKAIKNDLDSSLVKLGKALVCGLVDWPDVMRIWNPPAGSDSAITRIWKWLLEYSRYGRRRGSGLMTSSAENSGRPSLSSSLHDLTVLKPDSTLETAFAQLQLTDAPNNNTLGNNSPRSSLSISLSGSSLMRLNPGGSSPRSALAGNVSPRNNNTVGGNGSPRSSLNITLMRQSSGGNASQQQPRSISRQSSGGNSSLRSVESPVQGWSGQIGLSQRNSQNRSALGNSGEAREAPRFDQTLVLQPKGSTQPGKSSMSIRTNLSDSGNRPSQSREDCDDPLPVSVQLPDEMSSPRGRLGASAGRRAVSRSVSGEQSLGEQDDFSLEDYLVAMSHALMRRLHSIEKEELRERSVEYGQLASALNTLFFLQFGLQLDVSMRGRVLSLLAPSLALFLPVGESLFVVTATKKAGEFSLERWSPPSPYDFVIAGKYPNALSLESVIDHLSQGSEDYERFMSTRSFGESEMATVLAWLIPFLSGRIDPKLLSSAVASSKHL